MIRTATISDIPALQIIRNAVKENVLSDPSLVPDSDYVLFLTDRGQGWVYELDQEIVGFAIVDLVDENVWAIFVHPDFDRRGIGRILHDAMLDWYFEQGRQRIWLGTAPYSRAEAFYRAAGWREAGMHGKGEVKFEMRREDWVGRI
jgi:GNAT superfamily N-acetyltransferase